MWAGDRLPVVSRGRAATSARSSCSGGHGRGRRAGRVGTGRPCAGRGSGRSAGSARAAAGRDPGPRARRPGLPAGRAAASAAAPAASSLAASPRVRLPFCTPSWMRACWLCSRSQKNPSALAGAAAPTPAAMATAPARRRFLTPDIARPPRGTASWHRLCPAQGAAVATKIERQNGVSMGGSRPGRPYLPSLTARFPTGLLASRQAALPVLLRKAPLSRG